MIVSSTAPSERVNKAKNFNMSVDNVTRMRDNLRANAVSSRLSIHDEASQAQIEPKDISVGMK